MYVHMICQFEEPNLPGVLHFAGPFTNLHVPFDLPAAEEALAECLPLCQALHFKAVMINRTVVLTLY